MSKDHPSPSPSPAPTPSMLLAGLALLGVAFGFVEAAVVVDLRHIYEPLQQTYASPAPAPGELFPVLGLEELTRVSPEARILFNIEVAREAATILMLAGVGLCAGGSFVRRFAAFVAAFGIWDLAFYVSLKVLIDWPASVWTWDLLFLIPLPWSGPVLAPVVVALTMVACGVHTILRDFGPRPIKPTRFGWLTVSAGGLILLATFLRNSVTVLDGGIPVDFPWPHFACGEALAVAGYLTTAFPRRRPAS